MAQNNNLDSLIIDITANTGDAASSFRDLANAIKDFADKSENHMGGFQKVVSKVLSKLGAEVRETTGSVKQLDETLRDAADSAETTGVVFEKAAKTGLGKFFATVKRLAVYRAIRYALKAIATGISDGTKALIAWDREYGNNTSYAAKTADEIAAKWGELKKSIGAAAMPIIQILQPALIGLMNTVISVFNAMNMALRSFQGYSTYMKATAQVIGEGLDDATGKAKALQRVLFGFDELNVLPSPSGSGGGASKSTSSPLDFVETEIDNDKIGTFKSLLKLVEGIGAGLLTWNIAKGLLTRLKASKSVASGLAIAIGGAVVSFIELKDQLNNGVNWVNFTGLVGGATAMVVGLGKAFGSVGTAIGLMVGGITLAIAPLKELIKTGNLTTASGTQLGLSIAAVGASISKFTGSIVPLIAGGVLGGLVAGIAALKSSWFELKESMQIEIYGSTISEFTGKIKENAEAIRARREEIMSAIPEEQAELQYVNSRVKRYAKLAEKENLTAAEKEQLTVLTKEIISIYPELNSYIDEETGYLKLSADAWKKIYDEKLKNIKLQARQEKLVELYKAQFDAELKVKEGQEKVNKAYEEWQKALQDQKEISNLTDKLVTLRGKLINANGSTVDFTESEKSLLDEFTNGTSAISDLEVAIGDLNKQYDEAHKKVSATSDVYKEVVESQAKVREEYEKTGAAIDAITQDMFDSITKVSEKAPKIKVGIEIDPKGLANSTSRIYGTLASALAKNSLIMPIVSTNAPNIDNEITRRQSSISAIRFYASGGTPAVGTLFYAGESGSEIVANMSHGTGVMNVSQMQDAVANGNIEVVNAVYAMANMVAGAVNNKNFDVYMDTQKVGQSVSRYQYNQARRGVPQGAI